MNEFIPDSMAPPKIVPPIIPQNRSNKSSVVLAITITLCFIAAASAWLSSRLPPERPTIIKHQPHSEAFNDGYGYGHTQALLDFMNGTHRAGVDVSFMHGDLPGGPADWIAGYRSGYRDGQRDIKNSNIAL